MSPYSSLRTYKLFQNNVYFMHLHFVVYITSQLRDQKYSRKYANILLRNVYNIVVVTFCVTWK